jgi:hypothetical protein
MSLVSRRGRWIDASARMATNCARGWNSTCTLGATVNWHVTQLQHGLCGA